MTIPSPSVALARVPDARPLASVTPEDQARRLVAAFLAGRNPRTLAAYRQDLEDFAAWLGAPTVDAAGRILVGHTPGDANALALDYRNALLERGLAPATVNRRLAAVRSLVKLARTLGLVTWTLDVGSVRSERYRDTRGPGRQGVAKLLAALRGRTDVKAVRDRAIVHLLYDLGLRRGEVVSLDVEHVDPTAGTLSVLGKGRSAREPLTLPESTRAALAGWLTVRGTTPGPLFLNFDPAHKGARLTGVSVYRMIRRLGEAVGLHVRPHGLRHAAITDALDLTAGDVRAVQRFSRHRDLRVLTTYDDNRADLAGAVARRVAAGVALNA